MAPNKWLKRIQEMREKYGTTFMTMEDVYRFQVKYGLKKRDGKIGPETEGKIKELYINRKPKVGMSESNPFVLPELVVTAPKVDKRSRVEKIVDDFATNDPIFGQRRQELVSRYYDEKNPFRVGNDMVANVIMDAALTALTGVGLGSLAKQLVSQGTKALPTILATVAGAEGGQELFDQAILKMTGRPFDQYLQESGMDRYGRALFKPGAWAGGYGAGKVANTVMSGNAQAWFENIIPRYTITSQGMVKLAPGETISWGPRPAGYQTGTQGTSMYQGSYTTKGGYGRGSSAGQSGRVQAASGRQTTEGVQHRVMKDINSKGAKGSETYTHGNTPYTEPGSAGFIPVPGMPYIPIVPPVTPPGTPPQEPIRYEEYTPYEDPFIKWFGKQKEGTTAYYQGDPNHREGWYKIKRTKADPKATRRRVADEEGQVVPDSTTYKYNVTRGPEVNKLQGGVPKEAKRSDEKIIGFRSGGSLINRFKRYSRK